MAALAVGWVGSITGTSPGRSGRKCLGVAGEAGEALLVGIARRQRDLDAGDEFGDAGGDLEKAWRIVSNGAQHQNEVLDARPSRVWSSQ